MSGATLPGTPMEDLAATAIGATPCRELTPELARAIDAAVIAGSHLGAWLKADHPSASASLADGLRDYGGPRAEFDLWVGWRALEQLRLVFTGQPGPAIAPAVPPPEPDEAPGLAVEPLATNQEAQPRLNG